MRRPAHSSVIDAHVFRLHSNTVRCVKMSSSWMSTFTCFYLMWPFGPSLSGWQGSLHIHRGECQGAFWSVRWGVWGANLLSSWLNGQTEWRCSLFIWGDCVTQDSLYRWARHAQLSCQLAEVTAVEGKRRHAHVQPRKHRHVHNGSFGFHFWNFIN